MKEILEIRVDKAIAGKLREVPGLTLKAVGREPVVMHDIALPLEDARWPAILAICAGDSQPRTSWGKRLMDAMGLGASSGFQGYGYTVVSFKRTYSGAELAGAEFFELDPPPRPVLDREPEDEARIYDMSGACPKCRFGWRQKSELRFRKSSLKGDAILRVFGRNEWLVQESFRKATEGFHDGCEFRPVLELKSGKPIPDWHQLVVDPRAHLAVPESRFGSDPLHVGPEHALACPDGHTLGIRLCSEPWLRNRPENPISATAELVGGLDALNVPYPVLIVTRKIREAVVGSGLAKGVVFNRARISGPAGG